LNLIWNKTRDLAEGLKRAHSALEKKKLEDCTQYFAELSFKNFSVDTTNISISDVKNKFGRRVVSAIMPRFVYVTDVGNNLKGKISTVKFKKLSELNPLDRELVIKLRDVHQYPIKPLPLEGEYDFKTSSIISHQSIINAIEIAKEHDYISCVPFLNSLHNVLQTYGKVDFYYKASNNKRMYACWPGNVVGLPSKIRQELLGGSSIDISNAITDFHVSNIDIKKHPLFAYYAIETDAIRNFFAEKLNVDKDIIKRALHSVHVGANYAPGQIYKNLSSLVYVFNSDKRAAARFVMGAEPLLNAFKSARVEAIDSYSNKDKGYWESILPTSKNTVSFERRSQSKMFMSGYFDSEEFKRNILAELTQNYGLLTHDGIDGIPDNIIADLKKNTELKFRVKITKKNGKEAYIGKNTRMLSLKQILANENLTSDQRNFITMIENFKNKSGPNDLILGKLPENFQAEIDRQNAIDLMNSETHKRSTETSGKPDLIRGAFLLMQIKARTLASRLTAVTKTRQEKTDPIIVFSSSSTHTNIAVWGSDYFTTSLHTAVDPP